MNDKAYRRLYNTAVYFSYNTLHALSKPFKTGRYSCLWLKVNTVKQIYNITRHNSYSSHFFCLVFISQASSRYLDIDIWGVWRNIFCKKSNWHKAKTLFHKENIFSKKLFFNRQKPKICVNKYRHKPHNHMQANWYPHG